MSETPWRDESLLKELYIEKGKTMEEIAERFGCTAKTISVWVNKFGIKTGGKGCGSVYSVPIRTTKKGYTRITDEYGGVRNRTNLHKLIMVSEKGFDAVKENDVHHKNNIKWDNRPSNLELLTHEEHARLHAIEQHSN